VSKKKVLLRGVFINRDTNGEGVIKVGTTLIRVSTVMGILYDFRVMPLILMGRGKSMVNMKPSPDEYLWLQQKISKLKDLYQDEDFVISWGDPLDHLTRMPENNKNSMNTYSVEIRSDGKLLLCNYLPIVVGDLNKHSLKDYWHAGYNNIWGNNKLQPYISNLYSTEQFSSFCPEPYTGRDIVYDLIDAK